MDVCATEPHEPALGRSLSRRVRSLHRLARFAALGVRRRDELPVCQLDVHVVTAEPALQLERVVGELWIALAQMGPHARRILHDGGATLQRDSVDLAEDPARHHP